jgi:hypothetical protein
MYDPELDVPDWEEACCPKDCDVPNDVLDPPEFAVSWTDACPVVEVGKFR